MGCDLLVVGNDEAAFEVAIEAAQAGHSVVSVLPVVRHSAWIAAESLRSLTLQLAADFPVWRRPQLQRHRETRFVLSLLKRALSREIQFQQDRLQAVGVNVLHGEFCFSEDRTLVVFCPGSRQWRQLRADAFVIATGTRCGAALSYNGLEHLFSRLLMPEHLQLASGCRFGAGLAALYQIFGVSTELVTSCDSSESMLEFAAEMGVRTLSCSDFDTSPFDRFHRRNIAMQIDCRRHLGFTDHLQLEQLGVFPDDRGRLWCNEFQETWCSDVYAAGRVVGFSGRITSSISEQSGTILRQLEVNSGLRRSHAIPDSKMQSRVRNANG